MADEPFGDVPVETSRPVLSPARSAPGANSIGEHIVKVTPASVPSSRTASMSAAADPAAAAGGLPDPVRLHGGSAFGEDERAL